MGVGEARMNILATYGPHLMPLVILVAAVGSDLKTKKIKNKLVVISAVLAVASAFLFDGLNGLEAGALSLGLAFVLTLPLVVLRFIGAGDMKIFMALSLALHPPVVLKTLLYSLVWGAVLGLVQAVAKGQLRVLLYNMTAVFNKQKRQHIQTHQIPFAVALLLGWLSCVVRS